MSNELSKKDVIVLEPNSSLAEAIDLFTHFNISHCPVVTGGKLVGMITKTQVIEFVANALKAKESKPTTELFESMKVDLVMHTKVMQLPSDAKMETILEAMDGNEVGSVILTDNGKIRGIVTETDIVRFMRREMAEQINEQDQQHNLQDRLALWLYDNGVVTVSKALGDIGI